MNPFFSLLFIFSPVGRRGYTEYTSPPIICGFFSAVSEVNHPLKADDLPFDILSEGQQSPNPRSQFLSPLSHLISSSRRHCIISHPYKTKKAEDSTKRYFKRDRSHIHVTFFTIYCHNCSILSLVIVVTLLLCIIYKLNFIIGKHMGKIWHM